MKTSSECGFTISTYEEHQCEENARERFGPPDGDPDDRKTYRRLRFIKADGEITSKGWEVLNRDIQRLEANAMAWLRSTFSWARDEGHDSHDDLAGTVGFDASNEKHCRLIDLASETGRSERIDMCDASFGDLALTVWTGVSDFGAAILGGAILFYVDEADVELIDATLSSAREADKRSISDDDLCADCMRCIYRPGERSSCALSWPGKANADGYIVACTRFAPKSDQGTRRGAARYEVCVRGAGGEHQNVCFGETYETRALADHARDVLMGDGLVDATSYVREVAP